VRGQLAEGFHHAWQAVTIFRATLRVEANVAAILDDLEAEAVPFRFMQPIVALGWVDGSGGDEGADERETGWHVGKYRACQLRGKAGAQVITHGQPAQVGKATRKHAARDRRIEAPSLPLGARTRARAASGLCAPWRGEALTLDPGSNLCRDSA
jgi:hypothetical protein